MQWLLHSQIFMHKANTKYSRLYTMQAVCFCWDLISPAFPYFHLFSANEFTDMAPVIRVSTESCELIKNVCEYHICLTCTVFRPKALARKEIHLL